MALGTTPHCSAISRSKRCTSGQSGVMRRETSSTVRSVRGHLQNAVRVVGQDGDELAASASAIVPEERGDAAAVLGARRSPGCRKASSGRRGIFARGAAAPFASVRTGCWSLIA